MLYQPVWQLKDHFGEAQFGAWFDSAALVSYAVVNSEDGAKLISNNVGELTVPVVNKSETKSWRDFAWSKGSRRGRINHSTNLQKRPLILPHEVREMRADEQIIFRASRPPLRCGRAIMFRRPELMSVLGASRVREGSSKLPIRVATVPTMPTVPTPGAKCDAPPYPISPFAGDNPSLTTNAKSEAASSRYTQHNLGSMSPLSRQTVNDVCAEFCILVACFPSVLVVMRIAPSLHFLKTFKGIYCNARRLRRTFNHSHLLTGCNSLTTCFRNA